MRPGLSVGTEATVYDAVSMDMRPSFGGQIIHSVYGTAAMVYHMEWAARQVIVPYLETHEEGVGSGVQLKHMRPAPVGSRIRATARCVGVDGNVIVCDVAVFQGGDLLGEGQVEQRILPKHELHLRFPDCWPHADHSGEV